MGVNSFFDPSKPHHTRRGFRNSDGSSADRGLADVLRWRREAKRQRLPPAPSAPTPSVPPDIAFLHRNAGAGEAMEPAITWIGHATMLAQFGGITLLTDPVFSERASPIAFLGPRRRQPPAMTAATLPHIDVVLISHNHYDHLDDASIRALARQAGGPPLFIVPLGLKRWFGARGIGSVIELDWWQSTVAEARGNTIDIVLTPAHHWSARGVNDRCRTLWGGYAVFAADFHFFFAGDTGYSNDFREIRRRFADRQRSAGFDIALLPIGAYEPRWFMAPQHVDPKEAIQIHCDLGARRSVGLHWGTFELTDEALDAPPARLAAERHAAGVADDDFFVMALGETRRLAKR